MTTCATQARRLPMVVLQSQSERIPADWGGPNHFFAAPTPQRALCRGAPEFPLRRWAADGAGERQRIDGFMTRLTAWVSRRRRSWTRLFLCRRHAASSRSARRRPAGRRVLRQRPARHGGDGRSRFTWAGGCPRPLGGWLRRHRRGRAGDLRPHHAAPGHEEMARQAVRLLLLRLATGRAPATSWSPPP